MVTKLPRQAHLVRITVQDRDRVMDGRARELSGEEREIWWQRAVQAYPPSAEYQTRTDRLIPVQLIEPAS